jgi:hypothetical protein
MNNYSEYKLELDKIDSIKKEITKVSVEVTRKSSVKLTSEQGLKMYSVCKEDFKEAKDIPLIDQLLYLRIKGTTESTYTHNLNYYNSTSLKNIKDTLESSSFLKNTKLRQMLSKKDETQKVLIIEIKVYNSLNEANIDLMVNILVKYVIENLTVEVGQGPDSSTVTLNDYFDIQSWPYFFYIIGFQNSLINNPTRIQSKMKNLLVLSYYLKKSNSCGFLKFNNTTDKLLFDLKELKELIAWFKKSCQSYQSFIDCAGLQLNVKHTGF